MSNPFIFKGHADKGMQVTADPDDNKFVDCAIASNAKYIVSQDHHFDILKKIPFPKIDVVTIEEFLKEIS